MPVQYVVARRVFALMEQHLHDLPGKSRKVQVFPPLLLLFIVCSLLLSACRAQPAPAQSSQKSLPKNSSLQLATATPTTEGVVVHDSVTLVYALVAPFPTVSEGISLETLKRAWVDGNAPAPFEGKALLMDESTQAAIRALWGEPAPGAMQILPGSQLLETAWSDMPSWAIVPFDALEPKWKVLTIDGQSPIRKDFDLSSYPLVVNLILQSQNDVQSSVLTLPPPNYDPNKLTTVIMTGVTALVRATALTMEIKGTTYPGERIRELMREADIAHVSNEIPFFTGCTYPKANQVALVFCSDPKYMELLTDIGVDVVELTGNHFADRGSAGMRETIEIYKEKGLPYFGGGLDLKDSLKPALFEVNGNKIAFVGCNKPDVGRFPTATDFQPGAAPCKFPELTQTIAELKAQGFVVISTFQWNESYDSRPSPQQRDDFRLMADSGASIVSGSQAHYAQMMEFYDNSFIHYGLGNLFFDQMGDQDWMPPGIRRVFLDRYVIYNGKLISVEPIPAMVEDYARPRLMTDQERAGFLQEYFFYSGWVPFSPTPTPTITPTLTPMSIPAFPGTPTFVPTGTPTP
jgi:poly-gamma-glutamate synthesis protein (capsule biosynthesis protein)